MKMSTCSRTSSPVWYDDQRPRSLAVLPAIATTDARRWHAEILAIQEDVLGPGHPQTLVTKTHLAAEFLDAGEHWVAQAVLEEVLRVGKRVRTPGSGENSTLRPLLAIED